MNPTLRMILIGLVIFVVVLLLVRFGSSWFDRWWRDRIGRGLRLKSSEDRAINIWISNDGLNLPEPPAQVGDVWVKDGVHLTLTKHDGWQALPPGSGDAVLAAKVAALFTDDPGGRTLSDADHVLVPEVEAQQEIGTLGDVDAIVTIVEPVEEPPLDEIKGSMSLIRALPPGSRRFGGLDFEVEPMGEQPPAAAVADLAAAAGMTFEEAGQHAAEAMKQFGLLEPEVVVGAKRACSRPGFEEMWDGHRWVPICLVCGDEAAYCDGERHRRRGSLLDFSAERERIERARHAD